MRLQAFSDLLLVRPPSLTYMSIGHEIQQRCLEGRLVRLSGGLPGRPEIRAIYVVPDIATQLSDASEGRLPPAQEEQWTQVAQSLAWFIEGRLVVVPKEDRYSGNAFMLRLRRLARRWAAPPREVWEIRIKDPKPGMRLLGRFAAYDQFIALSRYDRMELGDPWKTWEGKKAWWAAAVQCKALWSNLFNGYQPLTGAYPDDYLSNAKCR